jgi:hypothetical protein
MNSFLRGEESHEEASDRPSDGKNDRDERQRHESIGQSILLITFCKGDARANDVNVKDENRYHY